MSGNMNQSEDLIMPQRRMMKGLNEENPDNGKPKEPSLEKREQF
jgi:hypothetical protein